MEYYIIKGYFCFKERTSMNYFQIHKIKKIMIQIK